MIKNTIKVVLLGLVVILGGNLFAQDCYIRLADPSGLNTDAYQADLEAAACELVAASPQEFQNDFKVYDFGFYLHNGVMQGGYPALFTEKVAEIAQMSDYYLIFGKQTDVDGVYTRIWVDLKLPQDSISCFANRATLNQILNSDINLNNYAQREIEVMETLTGFDCEICDNEIDDDGDGYVDCYDLDCMRIHNGLKGGNLEKSSDICY